MRAAVWAGLIFALPIALGAQRNNDGPWKIGTTLQVAPSDSRELDMGGAVSVEVSRRVAGSRQVWVALEGRLVGGVGDGYGDYVPAPGHHFDVLQGKRLRAFGTGVAVETKLGASVWLALRGAALAGSWEEYAVCGPSASGPCPVPRERRASWGWYGGSIYGAALRWQAIRSQPLAAEARWERWRFRHGATTPMIGIGLSVRF